jgi:hypothetical protein
VAVIRSTIKSSHILPLKKSSEAESGSAVMSREVRIEQLNVRLQLMGTKLQELRDKQQTLEYNTLTTSSPYPRFKEKERFKKELSEITDLTMELGQMLEQIERLASRLLLEA